MDWFNTTNPDRTFRNALNNKGLTMWKISEDVLSQLRSVNQQVKMLQDKLLVEAIKHDRALQIRVNDHNDSLDDYEIELRIVFYLREEHPNYKENDDNVVTQINEYLKGISRSALEYPWRWSDNHNEYRGWVEHPMKNEHHCWWFHALYDHNHLSVDDILSIRTISSEILLCYQYSDKLTLKDI